MDSRCHNSTLTHPLTNHPAPSLSALSPPPAARRGGAAGRRPRPAAGRSRCMHACMHPPLCCLLVGVCDSGSGCPAPGGGKLVNYSYFTNLPHTHTCTHTHAHRNSRLGQCYLLSSPPRARTRTNRRRRPTSRRRRRRTDAVLLVLRKRAAPTDATDDSATQGHKKQTNEKQASNPTHEPNTSAAIRAPHAQQARVPASSIASTAWTCSFNSQLARGGEKRSGTAASGASHAVRFAAG